MLDVCATLSTTLYHVVLIRGCTSISVICTIIIINICTLYLYNLTDLVGSYLLNIFALKLMFTCLFFLVAKLLYNYLCPSVCQV